MSFIYTPTRRRYATEDTFFDEGNIVLRAIRLKNQAITDLEKESIQLEEAGLAKEKQPIYCDTCRAYFPTVKSYEAHYEAQHRNVCLECSRVFPGYRWLQLHLDETHDILKQIKKERGEKIFACFVEGCTKYFSAPKMRKLHLMDKHNYPKHFPFDITLTGSLTYEQRRRRVQRKKMLAAKHHDNASVTSSSSHDNINNDNNDDNSDIDDNDRHETQDVSMNELVSSMSKLRIPKSISFGHAKPSLQRHQHHYNLRSTTKEVEMKDQVEKKVYARPRKRGPKKKRQPMQIDP